MCIKIDAVEGIALAIKKLRAKARRLVVTYFCPIITWILYTYYRISLYIASFKISLKRDKIRIFYGRFSVIKKSSIFLKKI